MMSAMNTSDVRAYYERNTRLFLALGASRRAHAIHRAVWAAGVSTVEDALNYSNQLVFEEIKRLCASRPGQALHVIDLGCGVGGSLFYLLSRFKDEAADRAGSLLATGVTISPLQVRLARAQAARLGLDSRCTFVEADFLHLPDLPLADAVFSIEALAHAPAPERYFAQAARLLRPGGRLMLCDDFLTEYGASGALSPRESMWLRAFQDGWRAPGLRAPVEITDMAARHGLARLDDRDLTPQLRLLNWNSQLVHALIWLGRAVWLPWAYWRSAVGSLALQHCLKAGLVTYRFLVFERA